MENKKINILVLTDIYPNSQNAGLGAFCKEQSTILSHDHSVTVVNFRVDYKSFSLWPAYTYEITEKPNIKEIRLSIKSSLPIYNQFNYFYTAFHFISKHLFRVTRYDIIHCHFAYSAGVLGCLLKKKFNIPIVITEHSSSLKGLFRSHIHKILVLHSLKNADQVIAVSASIKNEIEQYLRIPIEIVPNTIDESRFLLKVREKQDIVRIGFIGHLEDDRKGLDLLLEALSKLENKNFHLKIAGTGRLEKYYSELAASLEISNKCTFLGVIPTELIPEFLLEVDIFVLPSRKESFGVVIIEAMASGIPVISTVCGGPEFIINETSGLLIEKENPSELRIAIDYLIKNLCQYDPESIRKYAVENFGSAHFLNSFNAILTRVCASKRIHLLTPASAVVSAAHTNSSVEFNEIKSTSSLDKAP